MKRHINFASEYHKNFCGEFMKLLNARSSWEVWSDWVEVAALTISVPFEFRSRIRENRIERFNDVMNHYTNDEIKIFDTMFNIMVNALEDNPEQDFLGTLFEELELSNHWKGQFFTPYEVSYLMAHINLLDVGERLKKTRWVDILDPCCGAGVFFIAARNYLMKNGFTSNDMLYVGQDIDRTAALMGYIQISLLGCAGYIVVGNSLSDPVLYLTPDKLVPAESNKYDIWFTPTYRSSVWEYRRCNDLLLLEKQNEKRGESIEQRRTGEVTTSS